MFNPSIHVSLFRLLPKEWVEPIFFSEWEKRNGVNKEHRSRYIHVNFELEMPTVSSSASPCFRVLNRVMESEYLGPATFLVTLVSSQRENTLRSYEGSCISLTKAVKGAHDNSELKQCIIS
jgi:hypothetical protein